MNEDALELWNIMGQRFDWLALPAVCELYDLPLDNAILEALISIPRLTRPVN